MNGNPAMSGSPTMPAMNWRMMAPALLSVLQGASDPRYAQQTGQIGTNMMQLMMQQQQMGEMAQYRQGMLGQRKEEAGATAQYRQSRLGISERQVGLAEGKLEKKEKEERLFSDVLAGRIKDREPLTTTQLQKMMSKGGEGAVAQYISEATGGDLSVPAAARLLKDVEIGAQIQGQQIINRRIGSGKDKGKMQSYVMGILPDGTVDLKELDDPYWPPDHPMSIYGNLATIDAEMVKAEAAGDGGAVANLQATREAYMEGLSKVGNKHYTAAQQVDDIIAVAKAEMQVLGTRLDKAVVEDDEYLVLLRNLKAKLGSDLAKIVGKEHPLAMGYEYALPPEGYFGVQQAIAQEMGRQYEGHTHWARVWDALTPDERKVEIEGMQQWVKEQKRGKPTEAKGKPTKTTAYTPPKPYRAKVPPTPEEEQKRAGQRGFRETTRQRGKAYRVTKELGQRKKKLSDRIAKLQKTMERYGRTSRREKTLARLQRELQEME